MRPAFNIRDKQANIEDRNWISVSIIPILTKHHVVALLRGEDVLPIHPPTRPTNGDGDVCSESRPYRAATFYNEWLGDVLMTDRLYQARRNRWQWRTIDWWKWGPVCTGNVDSDIVRIEQSKHHVVALRETMFFRSIRQCVQARVSPRNGVDMRMRVSVLPKQYYY